MPIPEQNAYRVGISHAGISHVGYANEILDICMFAPCVDDDVYDDMIFVLKNILLS
jgi:hypothetical protein